MPILRSQLLHQLHINDNPSMFHLHHTEFDILLRHAHQLTVYPQSSAFKHVLNIALGPQNRWCKVTNIQCWKICLQCQICSSLNYMTSYISTGKNNVRTTSVVEFCTALRSRLYPLRPCIICAFIMIFASLTPMINQCIHHSRARVAAPLNPTIHQEL